MTLTRVGFIPLPPGKQPGFDHADVYRGQPPTVAPCMSLIRELIALRSSTAFPTPICAPLRMCPALPVS